MLQQRTRLFGSIAGLCTAGALLAGCGGGESAEHAQHQPAPQAPAQGQSAAGKQTSGTFENFSPAAKAITYKPDQVPVGGQINVSSSNADGKSKVTVEVKGLQPNRAYGAHVHVKSCGPTGEDAGSHYQEKADPVKPSVDPAFANPQNEVWLDFHTDAQGNGTATAEGSWALATRDDAQSVVIHETHTHSEPGKAGSAGGRLACIAADF